MNPEDLMKEFLESPKDRIESVKEKIRLDGTAPVDFEGILAREMDKDYIAARDESRGFIKEILNVWIDEMMRVTMASTALTQKLTQFLNSEEGQQIVLGCSDDPQVIATAINGCNEITVQISSLMDLLMAGMSAINNNHHEEIEAYSLFISYMVQRDITPSMFLNKIAAIVQLMIEIENKGRIAMAKEKA